MHIPDGFLDAKTAATTAALSAAGVGVALRRVRRELPPRRVPLLGLAAAFVFAAQMVNFPVLGGTSGHLLGGVLVAALLGPAAAVVVLTTVLIVQCFLFADGGVTALGANVFNTALLGTVAGWAIFRVVSRCLPPRRGQVVAVAFAGWCSAVLASLACAGQLAWSGTVAWSVGLPAMVGMHMLIGLGEGLISALVFLAIARTRPDLVAGADTQPAAASTRGLLGFGLIVSLGLAVFVAPFASPWPDGLEAVAVKLGFEHKAREPLLRAPVPDYAMPGLQSPVVATALAGLVGALVVFGLALLLSRALVPKLDRRASEPAEAAGSRSGPKAHPGRDRLHLFGHQHAHRDSPIHRLPAGLKLGGALALILGTVVLPAERIGWLTGVAVLLVLIAWASRLAPWFLFQRLLVLSPFVLGVALLNALQPAASADWRAVALRGMLCLATVILVSNTTPFTELLRVLRGARVPGLLVTTLTLMHRYLFVLADETERMRRARASRTFARGRRLAWRTLATVVGQLFIRASERAERIYDAMCARGWR